jgi:hypothetical protein
VYKEGKVNHYLQISLQTSPLNQKREVMPVFNKLTPLNTITEKLNNCLTDQEMLFDSKDSSFCSTELATTPISEPLIPEIKQKPQFRFKVIKL